MTNWAHYHKTTFYQFFVTFLVNDAAFLYDNLDNVFYEEMLREMLFIKFCESGPWYDVHLLFVHKFED